MIKLEINVKGMNCSSCEVAIDNRFAKIGIESQTSLINNKTVVDYDEKKWSQEDILNNISALGYKPTLNFTYKKTLEDYLELTELAISVVFTFFFIWNMFKEANWVAYAPSFMRNGYIQLAMASFIQLYVGRRFYRSSYYQLKNRKYGMDVLVAMSTTAAYLYSIYILIAHGAILSHGQHFFFDVSAEVITFLLIGKLIEKFVTKKATAKLREIVQSSERTITLLNGETRLSSELKMGDEYLIQVGQRVYADCQIIEGESTIDESSLTGESIPILKKVGDQILSGTINSSAPIKVKVLKESSNSKLEQLKESIHNLQKNKSKIAKLADTISHYFVPVVFWLIILTFIGWLFIAKVPGNRAMFYAIAVAVVACPCAIGLATPMSVVTGASVAIKYDILYNKGDVFEKFKDIDVVAFDKTGTVTYGELFIEEIYGDYSLHDQYISLEIISMHPIAKGFMNYGDENGCKRNLPFSEYKEYVGKGVSGKYQNSTYAIGSYKWITKEASISKELDNQYQKALKNGFVTVLGAKDNVVTTIFALKDKIKESSRIAIDDLHKQGIKTVMITGDNNKTAKIVADKLGIDQYYGEVKPLDKANIIKDLQSKGLNVAFAGDGVNDGAALSQADLAIVMGSGSDLAKSVSDITLLTSDLELIAKALVISNKTLRSIKTNLLFAFVWNGTMIPLAMLGYLQPWVAALAMSGESLVIVCKSQLLRLIKFKK